MQVQNRKDIDQLLIDEQCYYEVLLSNDDDKDEEENIFKPTGSDNSQSRTSSHGNSPLKQSVDQLPPLLQLI